MGVIGRKCYEIYEDNKGILLLIYFFIIFFVMLGCEMYCPQLKSLEVSIYVAFTMKIFKMKPNSWSILERDIYMVIINLVMYGVISKCGGDDVIFNAALLFPISMQCCIDFANTIGKYIWLENFFLRIKNKNM